MKKAPRMRILWLEDRKSEVENYASTIRSKAKQPVFFRFASTYKTACKMIDSELFHCIIIDIRLRGGPDGIQFAIVVRQRNMLVPIFFVTSFQSEYAQALKEVFHVSGVFPKTDLFGTGFRRFYRLLIRRALEYAEYEKSGLDDMTFEQFLEHASQNELAKLHWHMNRSWIHEYMAKNNLAWIMVCKSEVVAQSETMDTFPDARQRMRYAKRHKGIPFIYGPRIVSEERIPSAPLYLEYYPIVPYSVAGSVKEGNLDTGTNISLMSDQVLKPQSAPTLQSDIHLDEEFYYSMQVSDIKLHDHGDQRTSIPIRLPIAVVESWDRSPWVRVNPDRTAVFGRNLFAKKDLRIRLESHTSSKSMRTSVRERNKRGG